jgi:hypothetical protein
LDRSQYNMVIYGLPNIIVIQQWFEPFTAVIYEL